MSVLTLQAGHLDSMRDMLCDTELDVCEATDFTTVFQNLDQVRLLGMVLCKEEGEFTICYF